MLGGGLELITTANLLTGRRRSKELSLCNKIKYLNLNIFRTQCCKPLIFQTQINWSNRTHSLKYLRSATFGSKDIMIRKSEFVAKTQFLYATLPARHCDVDRSSSGFDFTHKYDKCKIRLHVRNSKHYVLLNSSSR